MNIEHHVTSLELSKRLKELGVPQDSAFYWQRHHSVDAPGGWTWSLSNTTNGNCVSAFLASELGELLPERCYAMREDAEWSAHRGQERFAIVTQTQVDTLAKLLIHLIECAQIGFSTWHAG